MLFLPQLGSGLVSVAAHTVHGVIVQFEQRRGVLLVNGSTVATVSKVGKLFAWRVGRGTVHEVNMVVGDAAVNVGVELWHTRAWSRVERKNEDGHVGMRRSPLLAGGSALCSGRALGKMTTSPFSHTSGSEVKTQVPFELVKNDVM